MRKMTTVFCGSNQAFAEYIMKHEIKPEDILYTKDPNYAVFFAKTIGRSWLITDVRLVFSVK